MTWRPCTVLLAVASLLAGCSTVSRAPEWSGSGPPNRVTIRGLISFPKSGPPKLVSCGHPVPFTLGEMSRGNLMYLKRRVGELSRRTPGPVTAEISGHIRKGASGYRIERPGLMYVAAGQCVDADDSSLDYQ